MTSSYLFRGKPLSILVLLWGQMALVEYFTVDSRKYTHLKIPGIVLGVGSEQCCPNFWYQRNLINIHLPCPIFHLSQYIHLLFWAGFCWCLEHWPFILVHLNLWRMPIALPTHWPSSVDWLVQRWVLQPARSTLQVNSLVKRSTS